MRKAAPHHQLRLLASSLKAPHRVTTCEQFRGDGFTIRWRRLQRTTSAQLALPGRSTRRRMTNCQEFATRHGLKTSCRQPIGRMARPEMSHICVTRERQSDYATAPLHRRRRLTLRQRGQTARPTPHHFHQENHSDHYRIEPGKRYRRRQHTTLSTSPARPRDQTGFCEVQTKSPRQDDSLPPRASSKAQLLSIKSIVNIRLFAG